MLEVGTIVNSSEFKEFLIDAAQHGYGSPDARVVSTTGRAKEITYAADPFLYVDNYVGGNPYAGYEFVAIETMTGPRPIWAMSYRETYLRGLKGKDLGAVLGMVLKEPDSELPIRGPRKSGFELPGLGDIEYRMYPITRRSNLTEFDAEESISLDGKRVYVARFMGGLISSHDE